MRQLFFAVVAGFELEGLTVKVDYKNLTKNKPVNIAANCFLQDKISTHLTGIYINWDRCYK